MILVLSGGGNEAKTFSALLEKENIPHLCVFATFAEAGTYGRGNAVVGRLNGRAMEHLLQKESICGVVDVALGGTAQSAAAMEACKNLHIPYVKYLRLPAVETDYHQVLMTCSYAEAAKQINSLLNTVLLYTAPETARAIAGYVEKPELLFAPILRGISFDVELALEFGIPLVNVIETDGIDGVSAVRAAVEKTGAKMLICDGSCEIADKLAAAEKLEIPVVITHRMGMEYTKTAQTPEEIVALAQSWEKK